MTEDKWLFLLKNLHLLDEIPSELREKAFQKLFNVAEIAKYKPQDRHKYEDSLKHYRDMENSLEVQYKAGAKDTKKEIALNMIADGESNAKIFKYTGLEIEQIEKLRNGGIGKK